MSLLVIQPGAIGDLVLSLPALRWLREGLGAQGMEVWAERPNLPLVDHPAYADRGRPLAETGLDSYPLPAGTLQTMKAFEVVVSWRGANLPELAASVTAAHPRAYFLPQLPPPDGCIHLTEFRRMQLSGLFGAEFSGQPEIFFHPSDEEFARDYLARDSAGGRPLVVLHPGASGRQKRWDATGFAELASRLTRRRNAQILLSQGPLDRQAVEAVMAAAPELEARRVSIGNLRHLAAVLRRCHLFVGNDTGITHLAAASGAPTVAIFQSTDPRLWAPRGRRVAALERPSLLEVAEEAESMLQDQNQKTMKGNAIPCPIAPSET